MNYRLLFFDRRHRLVDRFDFRAPNDAEAEAAAYDVLGAELRELWRGGHLLASWRKRQTERSTDTD
jgi:hypothetical protein